MTFAIGKNKYDINQIQEFEDYVFSFYGAEDALYQMNVTKDDITLATEDYLEAIAELDSDLFTWGDGDSLDRERVRDMLVRNYGYSKDFQTIRSFFTDGEWDTIANALEDYRHYDDESLQEDELIEGRSVYERCNEIDDRITKLFARTK